MSELFSNPYCLMEGILVIFEHQTESEQDCNCTRALNGVGFNGVDAPFASDITKKYILQGRMPSPKQLSALTKLMRKYEGQIDRLGETERVQEAPTITRLFKKYTDAEIAERASKLARAEVIDHIAQKYEEGNCNDFLCSVFEQYQRKQALSDKQWYYLTKSVAIDLLKAGL